DDHPRAGDWRHHGRQEGRARRPRYLPHPRSTLRAAALRGDRDRRRADLLSRARPRSGGRALRRREREGVLTVSSKLQQKSLFDRAIIKAAALDSFRKLSPLKVARNRVMFVVLVGSALTTLVALRDALGH